MITLIVAFVATIFATIDWSLSKNGGRDFPETLLKYLLFFNVGIAGLIGFVAHTFLADETAKTIGWPIGSPFQFEMGIANLSYGVLGLLCLRFHRLFWAATVIGYSILFLGCAYGHWVQMQKGDFHPWNAGPYIWITDFIMPLIILLLSAVAIKKKSV